MTRRTPPFAGSGGTRSPASQVLSGRSDFSLPIPAAFGVSSATGTSPTCFAFAPRIPRTRGGSGAWFFWVGRTETRSLLRRQRDLPGSWGARMRACPALRPRRATGDLAKTDTRDAAFHRSKNVGHRKNSSFEARSHGLHACCLRFAVRVTPSRRKTRFRPAWLGFDREGLSPSGLQMQLSGCHRGSSHPFCCTRLRLAHSNSGLSSSSGSPSQLPHCGPRTNLLRKRRK